MSIQALREQRAATATTLQALMTATEGKAWTADNQAAYDTGMAAIDGIDASIKRIVDFNSKVVAEAKRDEIVNEADKHAHDKKSPHAAIFAKWLRGGERSLSAEDASTFFNTMSTTTGAEGGFTVPTETATQLIQALKEFGGMREVANILGTASGNPMSFPSTDATSEIGEEVAENAPATAADTSFGTLSLPVFKFSSKSVAVPIELLQDSSTDIEAYINGLLVIRLGRITNLRYTRGNGTTQIRGMVTAAPAGFTAPNAGSEVTAVKYDSLVNLEHSVDPAYRKGPKVGFMMHDDSVLVVRKIKDVNGRPIFVPGYEVGTPGGAPDMILGRRITVNQDMPVMAAGAKSILFGDFNRYTIRDAMAVSLRRFDDSAFALKGQVGFCAWLRTGGNLLDVGGAVKAFVNAAT